MNKKKEVKKMVKIFENAECSHLCHKCEFEPKQNACLRYHAMTELQKAGYINGADFVEWLKKTITDVFMYDADDRLLESEYNRDFCSGEIVARDIVIENLDGAWQEYLKGE